MSERNPVPKAEWTIQHLRNSDLTVEDLEERRDSFLEAGWQTAAEEVQEMIDVLHGSPGLEERLVEIKTKIAEAEDRGIGDDPAVEKLRRVEETLEERLEGEDPKRIGDSWFTTTEAEPEGALLEGFSDGEDISDEEDLEALEERIEDYERVGWDKQAEEAREQLETLEAELDEDGGSDFESLSTSSSTSTTTRTTRDGYVVDVDAAVEQLESNCKSGDIKREFGPLDEEIEAMEERLEYLEQEGPDFRAEEVQAGKEILEAHRGGESTVEVETTPSWARDHRRKPRESKDSGGK